MIHISSDKFIIPDKRPLDEALHRTTHLGIGAHQDDLEIMAVHGILQCHHEKSLWFSGVIAGDGRGSPLGRPFAHLSADQLQQVRNKEQIEAAVLGQYSVLALLGHSSESIKDPSDKNLINDLIELCTVCRPETIYTHSLFDRHPTHLATVFKTIRAIRSLPNEAQPSHFYGCEVWTSLDWLVESDKIRLDVSSGKDLQNNLLEVYQSQIKGGKAYQQAAMGRRLANATFSDSHQTDSSSGVIFAMDLMPLIQDRQMDIISFIQSHINHFSTEIINRFQAINNSESQ